MAGLSKRGTGPEPEPTRRATRRRTGPTSSTGRTDRTGSRKQGASAGPKPVTTDLGLGRKLDDPEAPPVWSFRITRRTGNFQRPGVSNCTTYKDANDAAGDILTEYLQLSGTPREGWRHYVCVTTHLETGETGGYDGRDFR